MRATGFHAQQASLSVRAHPVRTLLVALAIAMLTVAGCQGPGPAPTPDPFSSLNERADEAFRQGLQAYEEGRFRDALAAFERAKLLSPQPDPRIDEFIERARQALSPTPTPAPPTATPAPPPPSPTPVFMNRSTPDAELGQRYFGQVFLTIVPGRNIVPPPMNEFYFEDQIGLYIEALGERLRLPFTMRVFDLDSGQLIAVARNEGVVPSPVATTTRPGGAPGAPTPSAPGTPGTPAPGTPGATATPGAGQTPGAQEPIVTNVVRFWDKFVWYREGGERPGRYRVELYANETLTHAFDYLVGNVPVAPPIAPPATPPPFVETVPPSGAQPGAPGVSQPGTTAPGTTGKPDQPAGTNGAAAPAAPTPAPTPTPLPTPTPTPAPAISVQIGGIPAGLDVNLGTRRVYVADASGVVYTVDRTRATLNTPFVTNRLPTDLVVDQLTGNLYLPVRSNPGVIVLNGTSGALLANITLPVNPTDVQLDSALGMLYVNLPDRQAISVIDARSGTIIRSTSGLPQVTGIALDANAHRLYVSHFAGTISILDGRTGQLIGRVSATSAGLSGVATANGQVYAINTATKEFVTVDPESREVARFPLAEEPGAIAAGEQSGTVYVVGTRSNSVIRLNPADGAEVGRVLLGNRAGRFGVQGQQSDFQGLRARLVLNRNDETVYVTQPEAGTLSIVPPLLFPALPEGHQDPTRSAPDVAQQPAPPPVPTVAPAPVPEPEPSNRLPAPRPVTPGSPSMVASTPEDGGELQVVAASVSP